LSTVAKYEIIKPPQREATTATKERPMVALAKPTKAERAAQARRDYIENTRPIAIDMDSDRPYAVVPS